MIEFLGSSFLGTHKLLEDLRTAFREEVRGGGQPPPLDREYLGRLTRWYSLQCEHIGLRGSARQATLMNAHLSGPVCNHSTVLAHLDSLLGQVFSELGEQKFAYIPTDHRKYFEQENLLLLGQPSPMPSTSHDIRDAGNAFAVGLYTASVFHLMRVAEVGLRVFAKHLRVRMPRKRGPVAWAQWHDILTAIRLKIDALSQGKGGKPKKSASREFYRGILAEFEAFKDVYRNNVMHVRWTYTRVEAERAIEQVGAFMQRLTSRLRE